MTAGLNLNSYREDNLGITEDQRARLDKVIRSVFHTTF